MPVHIDKHGDYHGNSVVHGNAYTDVHANVAHEDVAHENVGVHTNSHSNWHADFTPEP